MYTLKDFVKNEGVFMEYLRFIKKTISNTMFTFVNYRVIFVCRIQTKVLVEFRRPE